MTPPNVEPATRTSSAPAPVTIVDPPRTSTPVRSTELKPTGLSVRIPRGPPSVSDWPVAGPTLTNCVSPAPTAMVTLPAISPLSASVATIAVSTPPRR
jgi:hypothetical protein